MAKVKFKMPTKSNLKGRSSTISNAFAISITPYIYPTETEIEHFYELLDIKEGQCAYCLGDGNGRDHLKPLVRDGLPTGYITEINNLVPCCQACNSSKGAKDFSVWYNSPKNLKRLQARGLTDEDIRHRFEIISSYEQRISKPINYEKLVGKEKWEEYKAKKKNLIKQLNENQKFCDDLNNIIISKMDKKD